VVAVGLIIDVGGSVVGATAGAVIDNRQKDKKSSEIIYMWEQQPPPSVLGGVVVCLRIASRQMLLVESNWLRVVYLR